MRAAAMRLLLSQLYHNTQVLGERPLGPLLAQSRRQRFRQRCFLLGKDGTQIEHNAVVLDPCDYSSPRTMAKALLDLGRRAPFAANANNLGRKRLCRSRAAAGQ